MVKKGGKGWSFLDSRHRDGNVKCEEGDKKREEKLESVVMAAQSMLVITYD